MSFRRRLCFLFVGLPLGLYGYACSDDPAQVTPGGEDAGTLDSSALPNDGNDAATSDDAGGDASVVVCTGNPLVDDNAGADGGVVVDPDGGLVKAIATGRFLDGPQWIDDGAGGGVIVYSAVDSQAIVQNGADGGGRIVLRETGLGNLPIGNGRAGDFIYTALSRVAANDGGGAILRMGLDGGDPVTLSAGEANSPNDLVASSKGFVYFTDPGYQTDGVSTGVYQLAPDGGVTPITKFAGGTANRADGIALSRDEASLYVGFFDTKRIAKYSVDANGVASNPQDLALTLTDNPTGIAVDFGGNIWVAESPSADGAAPGRVEVFDGTGKRWGEIPFADSRPTGIAFGGPEGKSVYITTERGEVTDGTLYVLTSRCGGAP